MYKNMESVKQRLLGAYQYLLAPLVRIALKNGVSYAEFGEALMRAYVDVASSQLKAVGKNLTAEEIALVANVDVAAVHDVLESDQKLDYQRLGRHANFIPNLLEAWHTSPEYTGPYGVLRDLPFSQEVSDRPNDGVTFTKLVATYCPGISPRQVLEELIRIKCVVEVGKGHYRAIARSYIPEPLSVENTKVFARVVHDICETLEFNLRPEAQRDKGLTKGLMQRNIFTRKGLSKKGLQAFDLYLRDRGQQFSDDIDLWLSSNERNNDEEGFETGIGIYHYIVNEEDEQGFSTRLPTIEGIKNEH
jgi:hypothetical protein